MTFFYDHTGLFAFEYDGATYYYRKNSQNDIIAILDICGNVVVQYKYDAWGNHKVLGSSGNEITSTSHIGHLNPFRYRSYFYDVETGLYYLKSRYYDPKLGRFISADDISYIDPNTVNGLNLYAYCGNNPINNFDPSGNFAISTFLISLAVASLVSWGVSQTFGAQVASGVSSVANGGAAISTGASLLSFGPVGWVAGGILMIVGAATIAFGANEIVDGFTGTNYIQEWTSLSDSAYNGIYVGLNIASSLATISGNIYRNSRITYGLSKADKTAIAYSRYYQLEGKNVKSITHYGKGGTPKYRIDVTGRPHNGVLPHKHNFVTNNGFVNKGSVDDIKYWLWLLLGNWR